MLSRPGRACRSWEGYPGRESMGARFTLCPCFRGPQRLLGSSGRPRGRESMAPPPRARPVAPKWVVVAQTRRPSAIRLESRLRLHRLEDLVRPQHLVGDFGELAVVIAGVLAQPAV